MFSAKKLKRKKLTLWYPRQAEQWRREWTSTGVAEGVQGSGKGSSR